MAVSAALDVHQPRVHVELALDQRAPALLPDQPPRPGHHEGLFMRSSSLSSPAIKFAKHGSPLRIRPQPGVYSDCLGNAAKGEGRVIVLPVRISFLRVLELE